MFSLFTAMATGCTARTDSAVPGSITADPHPVRTPPTKPTGGFPRSAALFLTHQNLPSPKEFARYDLVVIDSEWFGRLGTGFFTELRTHNPDVRLLAYVNVVDYPPSMGERAQWADRYALWQYQSPTHSVFPREWLATTAGGQLVSEWPNTVMTNLTDAAKQIGGRTFAQYTADWVVNQIWKRRRMGWHFS